MAKIHIKAPDGRIVAAPRNVTQDTVIDGVPTAVLVESALKPGWSRATDADIAAMQATNKRGSVAQKGG